MALGAAGQAQFLLDAVGSVSVVCTLTLELGRGTTLLASS